MSKYGFCTTNVRCCLFQTFCTTYYGSPLWGLSGQSVKQLAVAWRKCIRKILKVDCRTHSCYLSKLIDRPDIHIELLCRFSSFIANCVNSSNGYVQYATKLARCSSSNVANNLRKLLAYINQGYSQIYEYMCNKTCMKKDILCKYESTCDDIQVINVLKELMLIRDHELLSPLTQREASTMLQYLCTH